MIERNVICPPCVCARKKKMKRKRESTGPRYFPAFCLFTVPPGGQRGAFAWKFFPTPRKMTCDKSTTPFHVRKKRLKYLLGNVNYEWKKKKEEKKDCRARPNSRTTNTCSFFTLDFFFTKDCVWTFSNSSFDSIVYKGLLRIKIDAIISMTCAWKSIIF